MTIEQKLACGIAILPLCADLLEDCEELIGQKLKVKIKNMIAQIRNLDEMIMNTADKEAIEQEINIQMAIRQFLKENFTAEL